MPKRIYVELVAVWGNGDAHARIKFSRRRWKNIQEGASYETSSYSYYEGRRSVVNWSFKKGKFSIYGSDCAEEIIDWPLVELEVSVGERGRPHKVF